MLDPISEMLTRIKNAQMAGYREVTIPASKLKFAIAQTLEKEGFVDLVQKIKVNNNEGIKITLKYNQVSLVKKDPAISEIKRISKQGKRFYIKKGDIRPVKNNYGISIISTSKGIMTGKEARKMGLGGEYICQVW